MAVRHFLLLICMLHCAGLICSTLLDVNDLETCNVFCKECNASAIFVNGHCECNFTEDNNEGVECLQRLQREIQAIDLNALSDDLTEEERNARSVLKARRRLRLGDADKVAQYFIKGGPSVGHSHFVAASNPNCDSADSAANSFSGMMGRNNAENEYLSMQSYLPLSVPISGSIVPGTYDSPLPMASEIAPLVSSPAMPSVETYTPVLGSLPPTLDYTEFQPNSAVGPIIHPFGLRGRTLPFRNALYRTATIPTQFLNDLFTPRSYRFPMHRGGIGRNALLPRDSSRTIPFVGQPCGNDSPAAADSPTAKNMDKSVEPTVAASNPNAKAANAPAIRPELHPIQIPQTPSTNTLYQPVQYRAAPIPYQYSPYYSPFFNPLPSGYVLPVVPHYWQPSLEPILSSPYNNTYHCSIDTTRNEDSTGIATTKLVTPDNEENINNENGEQASFTTEKDIPEKKQ